MNDAGFGAEQQVSRKARRAARYREEAARGAAVDEAALERLRRDQRNWAAGAEGERLVAQTLTVLERHGWTALHDVHWPGRPRANIDHIAIGPGGVVVIDAKHWSGTVELREGVLRQNGYARTGEVAGVADAAAAVTALLAPQHRSAVRAALCLVAQDQPAALAAGSAAVVGRWQLPELLLTLPPRLTPYDVADVGRQLTAALTGPVSPRLSSTADLARTGRRAARGAASRRRPPREVQRDVRPGPGDRGSVPARGGRGGRTARARGSSTGALLLRLAVVAVIGFLAIRVLPALVSSAVLIGH
ncbi:nuclease-related domain-containing protein [Cellulomonas sp. SG140]|uniref:nuclease-related domain-containing protein n=1 Tax=Cellulomonas sp. SG140 TaxID=2976536 RepID=UPI0021E7C59E|nr:nuclease-related domain-containing protein [Cellulomonas sp. SG140]